MKRKDIEKLHQLSVQELREKLTQAKKELVDLRMSEGKEKIKDIKAMGKKRDEVARVMTILKEKEFLEGVRKEPSDAKAMEGRKRKDEKV